MKIKGLRWIVLGLIMLVSIINYLDRGTLNYMFVANQKISVAASDVTFKEEDGTYRLVVDGESIVAMGDRVLLNGDGSYTYIKVGGIAAELGIIEQDLSLADYSARSKRLLANITIFFMIAYGLSQLFSGRIYDRIGTRKGFALSAVLWGAADAFTFLASGLKSLTSFRFLLGLGEAGPWPGTTKSNAEWFPQKERALAQGLFNAATSIGSVLAPIVIAFLYLAFGWKWTFIVIGSLAVIWIIPWLLINKKGPKEHPWITDKEREYILSGQLESKSSAPIKGKSWRELLKDKRNYSVILGRFFIDPVWWTFMTFLPIYLMEQYSLDIKEVAMSAWVPYVGAAIGAFAGGWFSGLLQKHGKSLNYARKCTIIVGALIALPGIVGAAMAVSANMAVIMMALILGGYQFLQSNLMTLPSDLHYGKTVGSLAGLSGASAVFGTILAMLIVPLITKVGWLPFFVFGGLLFPLSILCVFIFAGKIHNIDAEENIVK